MALDIEQIVDGTVNNAGVEAVSTVRDFLHAPSASGEYAITHELIGQTRVAA